MLKQMNNKKTFWLLMICLAMVTITFVTKTFQNDTFFTIPTGNYILENGVNEDEPFTWHENLKFTKLRWAFDCVVACIYNISGFTGLYIFTIIMAELIAISLFITLTKKGNNKIIAFLITLFTMITLSDYLACRGQIMSYLFFALEMYSIQKLMETHKKRYSVYLVSISMLILCFHSSVWLAYFFFYIPYIVEYLIVKLKINKIFEESNKIIIEKTSIKQLLITMIIAILCGFLTPLGLSPFTYMPKVIGGVSSEIIMELQPIMFEENLNLLLVIIGIVIILSLTKTKIKITDLFFILGFLIMSKLANRNVGIAIVALAMPILNLITSMILAYEKQDVFNEIEKKLGKITSIVLILLIFVFITVSKYKNIKKQQYYTNSDYPIGVADYIIENVNMENMRLYNHFNFGSYLEFRGIPTFIDSRSEIYCKEFNDVTIIEDFRDVDLNDSMPIDSLVEKYNITHIVAYSGANYVEYLNNSTNYKLLYSDMFFVLYEVVK